MATCVAQEKYRPVSQFNSVEDQYRFEQFLNDAEASVVVSQTDKQTAMKVEQLEIDAGVAGVGKAGGEVGPTGQKKCSGCANLAIGKLEEGTNFLSTEVTVARTAAAAGILWLTVLSG